MKKEFLYEGKAKKIFRSGEEGLYVVEYKDDATAFDGEKRGTIMGKGAINNRVSAHLFQLLAQAGIENHFVRLLSDQEMLVKGARIVALEIVVRNIAAGSISKRLGLPEGTKLPMPVVETYYKSDELKDPLINDDHIKVLNLAAPEQVQFMRDQALAVNAFLLDYLSERDVDLIDFKLEFGIAEQDGKLLLVDEISPDTCRFWDKKTGDKLDKDRFRRDLGGVEEAYNEILRRLVG